MNEERKKADVQNDHQSDTCWVKIIISKTLFYADWVSKLEPPFTYDHNHIGHSSVHVKTSRIKLLYFLQNQAILCKYMVTFKCVVSLTQCSIIFTSEKTTISFLPNYHHNLIIILPKVQQRFFQKPLFLPKPFHSNLHAPLFQQVVLELGETCTSSKKLSPQPLQFAFCMF